MEDFQAAFLQRSKDVEVLDRSGRYTAAMHFGGIVIECLLKYMLLTSMPKSNRGKKEWKTDSNNPGHIIRNPLHSYERAIGYARQYNSRLQGRIQRSPEVLKWIREVETPDLHFIDMRYWALQLLWGSRRERNLKSKNVSRWVYERLTDSSGTTFPRSLNNLLKIAKEYELSTYLGQPSPMDRLLRPKSLIEGLFSASEQRCHELREECSELIPFFDSLEGLNILTPRPELHKVWQRTVQNVLPEFKDFKKFVDFLLNIGLINLAELQGKQQGYRFAEIYTHGFKIYRGTRKY